MIDDLIGPDVTARLVTCLVSSLWQGALIALGAAALRLVLPRSAELRYWLGVTTLVAMLAAPVATFLAGAPDPLTGFAVSAAPSSDALVLVHAPAGVAPR